MILLSIKLIKQLILILKLLTYIVFTQYSFQDGHFLDGWISNFNDLFIYFSLSKVILDIDYFYSFYYLAIIIWISLTFYFNI